MTTPEAAGTTAPLEALALWIEQSGFVLRRVHAGHFVFRHPQLRSLVTVPAQPRPAVVTRVVAAVEGRLGPGADDEASRTAAAHSPDPTGAPVGDAMLLSTATALAAGAYERAATPLDGGGFIVQVPAFGAVIGQGETLEDAQQSARDALTAAIAVLLEDGDGVPAPAVEPAAHPAR